jgi:hypothetical protein
MFIRNVDIHIQVHTTLQPTTPTSIETNQNEMRVVVRIVYIPNAKNVVFISFEDKHANGHELHIMYSFCAFPADNA